MASPPPVSLSDLATLLEQDKAVKIAGCDVDGVLRGKLMTKAKFLSVAEKGFGFCSVIFGWDMHDHTYFKELTISNKENGYRDLIAIPDISSFRRIPWESNIPFFLVNFFDPDTGKSVSSCPRSLLGRAVEKMERNGVGALAGGRLMVIAQYAQAADIRGFSVVEYEFYQFRAPTSNGFDHDHGNSSATARFLKENPVANLPHLTEGMCGYSLTDPIRNQEWFYEIFDACDMFRCGIEGWHTESGPGVFEAALTYGEIREMADKATLFKLVTKNIGSKYGMTPCFMAKPREGLPGNSGHMHISLVNLETNENIFSRDIPDPNPRYADLKHLSDLGRHFLAGLLDGLPDVMPILAPTINSYKRLVENFWAPVTVSWGLEHRAASIRLIAPPTSPANGTRFEVRVPGADANPYMVLAAIVALGWRGVEKNMEIMTSPIWKGEADGRTSSTDARLAKTLKEANEKFMSPGSVAREVFGDEFVDHYGGTREHENKLWEEAVTDWEVKRYVEMV